MSEGLVSVCVSCVRARARRDVRCGLRGVRARAAERQSAPPGHMRLNAKSESSHTSHGSRLASASRAASRVRSVARRLILQHTAQGYRSLKDIYRSVLSLSHSVSLLESTRLARAPPAGPRSGLRDSPSGLVSRLQ